jgi:hypothetical protein
VSNAWLPDGLFSHQKSQSGYILEGLGMVNVGIFYGRLEYIMANWYILWPFGTVCGRLVYVGMIPVLVCLDPEKSGNPGHSNVLSPLADKWRYKRVLLNTWTANKPEMFMGFFTACHKLLVSDPVTL